MLRPMANLFAVADRDRGILDRIEERLRESREFARVWRPASGWVAAHAPLPESSHDDDAVRAGFAFTEGRDRLEDLGREWLVRVGALADDAPTRLSELPGDFGFIRFRPEGEALAVRSCAGLAPFYLRRSPRGGLAVGTLLNFFPRFLLGPFRPDRLINACGEFCWHFIDGRTFVEGVEMLPTASYTQLSAEGAGRSTTYWDPRPAAGDRLESSPDHARELRRRLIETLERDLDPGGRNLLTLSGGVDSCSVGALAAGVVGRGLSSWSLIPPHEPERSRELSYIDALSDEFGIMPARKRELTTEAQERWVAEARGLPFRVAHPALSELPAISSEQEVRVLVGGEFADHVCGHWARITDWVRHTSLPTLLARPGALPFGPRDYLRWARRRLLDRIHRPLLPTPKDLPPWAPPDVEEEYADWRRRRQAAVARDPRPLKELAEHVAADSWVVMNWEGTTPLGIRRSLPFYNREVLELAFSCHPRELLGPGIKRLLRAALEQDVPARYLHRTDKGAWGRGSREELITREPVRVTANGELPAGAERLARSSWLPSAPPGMNLAYVLSLRRALQVAEYLESNATRTDGRRRFG